MDKTNKENKFGQAAQVVIKDGPEFTTVEISGREFRIWAESASFGGDFDPAAVYKPGYEWAEKDFKPTEIILNSASLVATDGEPVDAQTSSTILNHLTEYYKAQGMTVQVD